MRFTSETSLVVGLLLFILHTGEGVNPPGGPIEASETGSALPTEGPNPVNPPSSSSPKGCSEENCKHGVCSADSDECLCNPGFVGTQCEIDHCKNKICGEQGVCNPSNGLCACNEGYDGDQCENDLCADADCSNDGECNKQTGGCRCRPGYYGDHCERDSCQGCRNAINIRCNPQTVCECVNHTMALPACNTTICDGYNCTRGAGCSLVDDYKPHCECPENFFGDKCEIDACQNGGYCHNDGKCIMEKDIPTCICTYFTGPKCEVNPCENVHCPTNSVCFNGACLCSRGFSGPNCTIDFCGSYRCDDSSDNVKSCDRLTSVCTCNEGFDGLFCKNGPSAPEPSAPGPSAPEPSAPGPSAPEPSGEKPSAEGSSAPGPSAAGPSAPGPSAPGPSAPEPSAEEPSAEGSSAPGPSATGPSAPGPSAPGPSAPGPSAPGPSAPGPSAPGPSAPGPSAPGPSAPGPSAPGQLAPGPLAPGPSTGSTAAVTVPGDNGSPPLADAADTDKKPPVVKQSIDESGFSFSSYLPAYFLVAVVLTIVGYVIYHHKQKILGLVVEVKNRGNESRSRTTRPSSKDYARLEENVSDAMPTADSKPYIY